MTAVQDRRDEVVEEVAKRYVANGYTLERQFVIRTSEGDELEADLVARRGAETVLVEVRLTTPLDRNPALAKLAEYAQQKGWRFVIAIADSRDIEEVEVPSKAEILRKAEEARLLGPGSTAFGLLAWSVLEAAARHALARVGNPVRVSPPRTLIQQLAAFGLVNPSEERELSGFVEARNRLAHGSWPSPEQLPNFERALTIAEHLLIDTTEPS